MFMFCLLSLGEGARRFAPLPLNTPKIKHNLIFLWEKENVFFSIFITFHFSVDKYKEIIEV